MAARNDRDAIEALRNLVEASEGLMDDMGECAFCDGTPQFPNWERGHDPDCPWKLAYSLLSRME